MQLYAMCWNSQSSVSVLQEQSLEAVLTLIHDNNTFIFSRVGVQKFASSIVYNKTNQNKKYPKIKGKFLVNSKF